MLPDRLLILWACGLVLMIAFPYPVSEGRRLRIGERERPTGGEFLIVGALLALGLCLRLYRLNELPVFIHNDEAAIGLEARRVLALPHPYLFGSGWAGLPNLSYVLSGASMLMFGDTLFGLRMGSVLQGTLSLLGVYMLARLLFGKRAAMWTLVFTVPFHWNVHLGRTGHHYVQPLLFTPWVIWAFLRAMAEDRTRMQLAAGLLLGAALHTYFASRLLLFLLAVIWLFLFVVERERRGYCVRSFARIYGAAFYAVFPSLVWYHAHPGAFFERMKQVSIFAPVNAAHISIVTHASDRADLFKYQIAHSFGLLWSNGDSCLQYGTLEPFLNGPLLVPALASLAVCLLLSRRLPWFVISVWIVSTFAAAILTIDPPSVQRLASLAGALYIPLGVFTSKLIDSCRTDRVRRGTAVVLIVAAGFHWNEQVDRYFRRYWAGARRTIHDAVLRVAEEHPEARAVYSLSAKEAYTDEAYRFMAPGVRLVERRETTLDSIRRCSFPLQSMIFTSSEQMLDEALAMKHERLSILMRGARVFSPERTLYWAIVSCVQSSETFSADTPS